jgi:hypothetical protein
MTTTQRQIATAYRELQVRRTAAAHLRGIPARQNASAISHLYDQLNHLNIQLIEEGGSR